MSAAFLITLAKLAYLCFLMTVWCLFNAALCL